MFFLFFFRKTGIYVYATLCEFCSKINRFHFLRRVLKFGVHNSIFKRFFCVHIVTFYALSLLKSATIIHQEIFLSSVFVNIFSIICPTLFTTCLLCIFFNYDWGWFWLLCILRFLYNANTTICRIWCIIWGWNL